MSDQADLEQAIAEAISDFCAGVLMPSPADILAVMQNITANHVLIVWGPDDVRRELMFHVAPLILPPLPDQVQFAMTLAERSAPYWPHLAFSDDLAGDLLDECDLPNISPDHIAAKLDDWIESGRIDLAEIASNTLAHFEYVKKQATEGGPAA